MNSTANNTTNDTLSEAEFKRRFSTEEHDTPKYLTTPIALVKRRVLLPVHFSTTCYA